MKYLAFPLLIAALLAAGCGDKPDPVALACPVRSVKLASDNTYLMRSLEEGRTPASVLLKKKAVRKATLEKPGEAPLRVLFFQTGVPGCPWVASNSVTTAVVVKDGFIFRVGNDRLRDLTEDGWVVREAAWPWQDYDFGYIPAK